MRTPAIAAILTVALLGASTLLAAEKEATVDAVLEKYVKAIGGKEAWNKVETRRIKGDLKANDATSEWTLEGKAPNKLHTRSDVPGLGLIENGYDGKTGWEKGLEGLRTKQDDDLRRAQKQADFRREIHLKELYPELKYKGAEKFNDEDVQILEAAPSPTSTDRFTFSTRTGLLVRQQTRFDRDGTPWEVDTELSDYREVDGVKYAHHHHTRILIAGNSVFEFELKIKEIKHNEKIDDAQFTKPAE
jgi:zinc protease